MNPFLAGLVLLLVSLPGAWVFAGDPAEMGRHLAQQVYDRPDGRDMTTVGRMELVEQGRSPRTREMTTYRLDLGDGEIWSLIRFTAPADINETGLLTLDHADGATDQWVYLPALDRSRRIPAARRGGRFVSSDIFYEDLQDRKVEQDHHRLVGEEELFGVRTKVLESIPVDAANSVYGKRLSWIHPDVLLPLRIDFFQPGRDEPFKRMTVQQIEDIQGYWTVMENTMDDLESGHRTRIIMDQVIYDRDLPESLFSSTVLEDPSREAQHRP